MIPGIHPKRLKRLFIHPHRQKNVGIIHPMRQTGRFDEEPKADQATPNIRGSRRPLKVFGSRRMRSL